MKCRYLLFHKIPEIWNVKFKTFYLGRCIKLHKQKVIMWTSSSLFYELTNLKHFQADAESETLYNAD
jgi:hypothetical protein